jgi:hypothetical protein
MHRKSFLRHVAFGIDVAVKCLAGGHAIEDLNAADFNKPIASQRIETGGFGIQNDFTHV